MNDLQQFFEKNESNVIHKWMHYFDIYDQYFKKYRNKPVTILEIGVYQGGSLKMWNDYFGEHVMIYAIDIDPRTRQYETDNVKLFIGSQEDRNFLQEVKKQIPKVDIIIDDGGHTMRQQIVSFEELYDHVKVDGIYLCEDLHTSYWENYGGGYKYSKSFIEYSKNFIDQLNAWHSTETKLQVNEFTRSTYALHFYDSILVIEKKEMTKPQLRMTGTLISIPIEDFKEPDLKIDTVRSQLRRLKRNVLRKVSLKAKK